MHLQRALAARPDDSTLHMNLGSVLFETGAIDAGLAYLQRACELAPRSAPTWYNYGKALQFSARMEQARDVLMARSARYGSKLDLLRARLHAAGLQGKAP